MLATVLGSGSEGNATLAYTDDTALLLDAGFTAKELERRLEAVGFDPERLTGILITHEHGDHLRGATVFARRYKLPVFMTAGTAVAVDDKLIDSGLLRAVTPGEPFMIGDIGVDPFSVPHDVAEPVAYMLEAGGRRLVNLTDFGVPTARIVGKLSQAHMAIVESNHELEMLKIGPYPMQLKQRIMGDKGHISNDQCIEMLDAAGGAELRTVVFAHLSKINNSPDNVRKSAELLYGGTDVRYEVARQDAPGETYEV